MIKEVWGDAVKMLKSKEISVLAHGCNCFNTMGSGIAAEIAKFFPDAVISDKMTKYGDINKLGNIDIVYIQHEEDDLVEETVVNCYTQFSPGADVSYAAIEMCLRKLNQEFKGRHIAMPRIGAGVAGGNWLLIRELIRKCCADCDVTIIYFEGDRNEVS